jgi:murein DD-endopeptidase MepM/ murein hydrolase activator NlpD
LSDRFFTVMVVPERSSRAMRFTFSRTLVNTTVIGLSVGVVLATMWGFHYLHVVDRVDENQTLREANLTLQADLRRVEGQVDSVRRSLDRIRRFDTKLRAVTQLSDPERGLAIGPLAPRSETEDPAELLPEDEDQSPFLRADSREMRLQAVAARVEALQEDAAEREASVRDLEQFFEARQALLSSTPSILPTHGWITSNFGPRSDPFTGAKQMHRGLDIANETGTPVIAPADGIVVYQGARGSYGNVVVIDHGFGVKTAYAHLSQAFPRVNQEVRRGERIGLIGNTGRSVGPHLHYEVLFHGIPVNPRKYVLEDGD